jgi:cytidylate kinase
MDKWEQFPVVTLDGPSGSGKGTLGSMIAKALNWHFLDSGALYRVLALAAQQQRVDLANEETLATLASTLEVEFKGDIFWSGHSVTQVIRSEQCGNIASKIAVYPKIREALLEKQRAFCRSPGLVADGRDMGTLVFPHAFLKIFLEASAEERAKRRYLQLKDQGKDVTLKCLLQEIRERDLRDKTRLVAPLIPAEGAVVIDTTGIGVETVFSHIMGEIKDRLLRI